MDRKSNQKILFIIPNDLDHGAQNFFRRLSKAFKSDNKLLFVESKEGNLFSKLKKILKFSAEYKLIIFATVNSNILALIIKICIPKTIIIPRLGNTISLELRRY